MGRTVMMKVTNDEHLSLMEMLLEYRAYGTAVDDTDMNGETALMHAVRTKQLEAAKLLLRYGANVNISSKHDITALMIAVLQGNKQMVKLLLENGADITTDTGGLYGNDFTLAIKRGHWEVAQQLIAHSATKNNELWSPLHQAVLNQDHSRVKQLLETDTLETDATVWQGQPLSAVDLALAMQNEEILALLSTSAVGINVADADGKTPLIKFSARGDLKMVRQLLQLGARVDNEGSNSALLVAIQAKQPGIAKLLLESGAAIDVDAVNADGSTALIIATQQGFADIVAELLQREANTMLADRHGNTALTYAANQGNMKIVNMLLQSKADANAVTIMIVVCYF